MKLENFVSTTFLIALLTVVLFVGVWQIKPAYATRVFYDGFEDGTVNAWSDTWNVWDGDCAARNDGAVYNGTYSLRTIVTAANGWGIIANDVADNQILYMRYIFWLDSITAADGGMLVIDGFTYGGGWNPQALVGVKRSGSTYVWCKAYGDGSGAYTWVNSTSTLNLQQHYDVQLGLYRHASAGWVSLEVNGTSISNTTSLALGANNPTRFEVGLSGLIATAYFDDVMVDTVEITPDIIVESDVSPPSFGVIYANTTIAGSTVRLSCAITDGTDVANYTYSWNNTGTWINQTTVNTSGNQVPSIHNGLWNTTSGFIVSVIVYANDTLLNEGASTQYNFTLTTENQPVVLVITNPTNITYASSSIPVFLSASGGTIDKIWYNVKNGSSWIYGSNQTYVSSTSLTGYLNGTSFNMTVWANNTFGNSDTDNIMFSVAIANVYSVTAASGTASAIQTAVNDVANHGGGVVNVPAGTYNFVASGASWITIEVPAGVSIIGAEPTGINATLILHDSTSLGIPQTWNTILVDPSAHGGGVDSQVPWFNLGTTTWSAHSVEKTCRFANIKLVGYRTAVPSYTGLYRGVVIAGLMDWRVDHCCFENLGGPSVTAAQWYDWCYWTNGVMDHCSSYNQYGSDDLVNYANSNIAYGVELHRATPTYTLNFDATMTVLGQYSNYTTFIENCFFSRYRHVVSAGHGSYYVFRYNLVNNDCGHFSLDVHGKRDSQAGTGGARGMEAYENTFTNQYDFGGLFQDGGGCGVWFNNYVDSSYDKIALYAEDYVASSTWHLKDFYMWSAIGTIIYAGYPTGTIDSSRHVVEDWTRQAGTPSSPSYPNVDGSWSITGYLPYTYPHPLVSGASLAILVLSVMSPINTTYSSPTIYMTIITSGATPEYVGWNCTFTNGTVVYANTAYMGSTSMTLGVGNYIFRAMANTTDGDSDEVTVMFTVEIAVFTSEWGGYWGRWWGYP